MCECVSVCVCVWCVCVHVMCLCVWCVCVCECVCVCACDVFVFVCMCMCMCYYVQKDFCRQSHHTDYLRKENFRRTDGCGKKYSCDCDWLTSQCIERAVQTGTLLQIGGFCGLGVELLRFWQCGYLALHWLLTVRSPVVTICTASSTFHNSTFCPHTVIMCFVWISEQTAIISLYNINWLVFITEI